MDDLSKAAAAMGRKGGQAGTGEAKRRPHTTSEHMRAIRAKRRCECGKITGVACAAYQAGGALIEHMPECLRASHEAAGNRGIYPLNGAIRLRVARACARLLVDDNWTTRVR